MEKNRIKIAIIGAGITGLTSAFYLKKNGFDVTIFEKSEHIGGVINSISEEGFVYETGPNSGTLSNIETVELFEYLADSFELQIADEKAKKRLIWKKNKWHVLPADPIRGLFTPIFSLKDKFKILGEPFRKPGTNPLESVAELVKRRLGNSFLDYAVDPFISGIYAGDPELLVTKYALPKLFNLEQDYGSFIGGAIKKAKEHRTDRDKKVSKQIFSAKNGLHSIIDALSKKIGEQNIILNSNITVFKENSNYKINDQIFSYVISTVNASELPQLFPFIDASKLKDIINLKYAKVAEIVLGFKNWNGIELNAFGGLVPTVEHKNILGILFMSTLFKDRAAENGALLTSFVGGIKKQSLVQMPENELINLLEKDFVQMLGLKNFKPDLLKVFYHQKAIAQYEKNSVSRLKSIENIEQENNNLFLAGSIRDGIGMADRIKQGTDIANKIIFSIK